MHDSRQQQQGEPLLQLQPLVLAQHPQQQQTQ
jgi:hypothetical protein